MARSCPSQPPPPRTCTRVTPARAPSGSSARSPSSAWQRARSWGPRSWERFRPEAALARFGVLGGPLTALIAPAWRWVFYINVPIGIAALALGWAATAGWDTPRTRSRLDLAGATLFTLAAGAILLGITIFGESGGAGETLGLDPAFLSVGLLALGLVAGTAAVVHGLRRPDPFLDPRLFGDRVFSSAALVSLLTGYGFATAIVGAAVFVDRVLYGGPDQQRVALGALAAMTATGALASGWLVRRISLRAVSLAGLAASVAGLVWMGTWTADVPLGAVAAGGGLFGLGFGLTVTPRSTAAVEAVGPERYGAASATVTVARMIGMAVGLAVLTAYGSTAISRLSAEVYASPDAYRSIVPAGPGHPAAPRRARRRRPRDLGCPQGRRDHGGALPRRGWRDGGSDAGGARARRSAAYAHRRDGRGHATGGRRRRGWRRRGRRRHLRLRRALTRRRRARRWPRKPPRRSGSSTAAPTVPAR